MISVRQAQLSDMDKVLAILDDFRTVVLKILDPASSQISDTARTRGTEVFKDVINSTDGAIFIAFDEERCVGVITIYKIPQIRKGIYRAEIEEIFADPEYHGKGVGAALMTAAENWARTNGMVTIQLVSDFHLKRAHHFYAKRGFAENCKSFEKKL